MRFPTFLQIHDDDPPEIKEDVDNDRINEADKVSCSRLDFVSDVGLRSGKTG